MKEGDTYCGLDCGELIDTLRERILVHVIEHAKHDPDFAPEMIDRLIAECMKAKASLLKASAIETEIGPAV